MLISWDDNIKRFLGAILLLCILTIFFRLFRSQLRIAWLAFRLPGTFAVVLTGNSMLTEVTKCSTLFAQTCREKYGPIFRVWVTVIPLIVVLEPNYIQKILSSSKHVNKLSFYQFFRNILGEGLISANGEKWYYHRKLIQPFFHISTLENLFQISKKGSEVLVARIEDQIKNKSSQFDIMSLIRQSVQSISTEMILGIPMDLTASPIEKKRVPFQKANLNLLICPIQPWCLPNVIYKYTGAFKRTVETKNTLRSLFKKIVKERQNGTIENKCFLDYTLEVNKTHPDFTEEDCFEECRTFLTAGQQTVEVAVALFLLEMAKHPDIQEKVVEELDSVLGSSEKNFTLATLSELTYLEQCIKESMRLYPTAPMIGRTLGEDVRLGDYTLPKGCRVLFPIYVTHRLADHFKNPEVFDPDRFHPNKVQDMSPCSFLPFSAGPRICLGYKFAMQELKTMTAMVLKNYRLSPVQNKEQLNLSYGIIIRISGGVWVNFTPRHQIPAYDATTKLNII